MLCGANLTSALSLPYPNSAGENKLKYSKPAKKTYSLQLKTTILIKKL
jgi:hypothetical protein